MTFSAIFLISRTKVNKKSLFTFGLVHSVELFTERVQSAVEWSENSCNDLKFEFFA